MARKKLLRTARYREKVESENHKIRSYGKIIQTSLKTKLLNDFYNHFDIDIVLSIAKLSPTTASEKP